MSLRIKNNLPSDTILGHVVVPGAARIALACDRLKDRNLEGSSQSLEESQQQWGWVILGAAFRPYDNHTPLASMLMRE
jgi:hypothetical protein